MSIEKYATLLAYCNTQEKILRELTEKIIKLVPLDEDKMVHSAYLLHNFYSALEDLFKEISHSFENNIDRNSGYHKYLLVRIKMEIPGIRPAVITDLSYTLLSDLLGFRHVFRHAYSYHLVPDKMERLRTLFIQNNQYVFIDLEKFKNFLKEKIS